MRVPPDKLPPEFGSSSLSPRFCMWQPARISNQSKRRLAGHRWRCKRMPGWLQSRRATQTSASQYLGQERSETSVLTGVKPCSIRSPVQELSHLMGFGHTEPDELAKYAFYP